MSERFPGVLRAYIGPNAAHRTFRASIANAKALAFILASDEASVLQKFLDFAEATKSESPDGNYAIGVAGRVTSNTMQGAIHLTGNEIDLVTAGGFVSQAFWLIYREVYRVFESFLIDLFEEIGLAEKRVLFSEQKVTYEEALRASDISGIHRLIMDKRKAQLTRAGYTGLEKVYDGIGLSIIPMSEPPPKTEQEDARRRLIELSAIRNIMEHNQSVVNDEFMSLVTGSQYKLGDRIAISSPELGDALSAVEWTADQLNKRAIKKFGVGVSTA